MSVLRARTEGSTLRVRLTFGPLWLALVVTAACGGKSATSPTSPATATPPPSSWSEDLDIDQREAFMKRNIEPTMGAVFRGHDPTRYASFGCATCHGPDYAAPRDFLPHLTMKEGQLTAFAEKPAIAKFMAEIVAPRMATAMGLPPYDPKTRQGFGCGGCHTIDMK